MTRRASALVSTAARRAVLALALVSASAPVAAAQYRDFDYGSPMMGWGWGWGGTIVMPLFMVALIVAIIVFIVALVRWLAWPRAAPPRNTALEILRERFARGEIDQHEFDERRRILGD